MTSSTEQMFAEVAAKMAKRRVAIVREWIESRKEAVSKPRTTAPLSALSAGKRAARQ